MHTLKLKPCPFCDLIHKPVVKKHSHGMYYIVGCTLFPVANFWTEGRGEENV